MSGHGIPRVSDIEPQTDEAKQRERKRIEQYRDLVDQVTERVRDGQYNDDTFTLTTQLLKQNPEYYTIWNYRRLILLAKINSTTSNEDSTQPKAQQGLSLLLSNDLSFLVSLMLKFPKCYWLWNHRAWLLRQATERLPLPVAREFWTQELGLVNKMLGRDSRNFHGWGYRRTVVAELEQLRRRDGASEEASSMAEQEYEYTRKMIGQNLSNFSAWHSRSTLILRILQERKADAAQRKQMLDDELELIHEALIDPQDQSLWFYYQFLMMPFDPKTAADSIVPQLTTDTRLQYLEAEIEYVLDILDGAENVKWVYVTLIQLADIHNAQSKSWPDRASKEAVVNWMAELKQLDRLRKNRWDDWSRVLNI